jgi:hypothetical protein
MISTTPLLTGLATALLCIAWSTMLLPLNRLPVAARLLVIVTITLLVMLPLADNPGWFYVRSIFGDSSITGLLFYIALILQQYFSWQLYQENELLLLRRLVLAAAILLYPFALGLTRFDSYSLGYANPWLLAILFIIALFFWLKKYYFLALTITAAVFACTLQLLESLNLWDYLLDPLFVVLVMLTWLRPPLSRAYALKPDM